MAREGPAPEKGYRSRLRRLSHSYTRTASIFNYSGTAGYDIRKGTVLSHFFGNLGRTGAYYQTYIRMNSLAFKYLGNLHQIRIRGIGAGAYCHLVNLYLTYGNHDINIIRTVRLRRHRNQLIKIYDKLVVILSIGICR